MEDELFDALYRLVWEEGNRRPRRKRVHYPDALILLVVMWAVLHDRPINWACRRGNWHKKWWWMDLPSPATMSQRLRTLSVQLLLEQVFYRLLAAVAVCGFCLCRRLDSKPLPVGGFTKDRDARHWGYAAGGKSKGYRLCGCWGRSPTMPEALVLGGMNQSDPAGAMQLIDQLQQRLHGGNACGYVLADANYDSNPLHEHAKSNGFQLLAPRKEPGTGLGHRPHSLHRLRSIQLLEPPPAWVGGSRFGLELYRQRGQVERDLGNAGSFGGGLQPLPNFVRRPRRVTRWVIIKLIINGLRICRNQGLTP